MSDPRPVPRLDEIVFELVLHCRARCGFGFGRYPCGVRHAIAQLLPMVNRDYRGTNGYGNPTKSIRELVAEIDERLRS